MDWDARLLALGRSCTAEAAAGVWGGAHPEVGVAVSVAVTIGAQQRHEQSERGRLGVVVVQGLRALQREWGCPSAGSFSVWFCNHSVYV